MCFDTAVVARILACSPHHLHTFTAILPKLLSVVIYVATIPYPSDPHGTRHILIVCMRPLLYEHHYIKNMHATFQSNQIHYCFLQHRLNWITFANGNYGIF